MRFFVLGGLVLALAGCGLEEAGRLTDDDSGPDVKDTGTFDVARDAPVDAADATVDAGPDVVDAGPDAFDAGPDAFDAGPDVVDAGPDVVDSGCPTNACTLANVPAGWDPIAYKENASTCPATFNTSQFVTNPVAGNACTCGCAVSQKPTCDVGATATFFSNAPGCGSNGPSIIFNGGCNTGVNGSLENYHKSTTIPLSGGACNANPVVGAAGSTSVASCAPTVCKEDICAGTVPSGYSACIQAQSTGDQSCPASSPFSVKHLVGTSVGVSCSNACTCQVTGQCTSPKVAFYSDNNCQNLVVSLDSNNTCVATNTNSGVSSAKYTATVTNPSCTTGGTTTPNLSLNASRTICCRP